MLTIPAASAALPFGAIPPPPGNALELGPVTVHYYGIAIALGVLAAITLGRRRFARLGGQPEVLDRVALWGVVAGLVGARLAWVVTNFDRVIERPLTVIAIWEGGLAFFGGLALGAAVAIWQLRRSGASVAMFADAAAPAIPLAQAIGRWGNYFNEELYGTATDLPWALELSTGETVHPTFLYESLGNLVLVGVLLVIAHRGVVRSGRLLLCYGIGYGAMRFSLEFIRTDGNIFILGWSGNTWVALGVLLGSVAALAWWQRREPVPAAADGATRPGRARRD